MRVPQSEIEVAANLDAQEHELHRALGAGAAALTAGLDAHDALLENTTRALIAQLRGAAAELSQATEAGTRRLELLAARIDASRRNT